MPIDVNDSQSARGKGLSDQLAAMTSLWLELSAQERHPASIRHFCLELIQPFLKPSLGAHDGIVHFSIGVTRGVAGHPAQSVSQPSVFESASLKRRAE